MQVRSGQPAAAGRPRSLADIPRPRPLPLLGNLYQVRIRQLHQSLEAWVRQYGPYFRFSVGRGDILVVADPIAIAAILRDRPEGFRRPRQLEGIFEEMGIAGVFSVNDDVWRRQRKIVSAAFAQRHVKAYFPSLVRVTQRFYRRWRDHASAARPFDLQADLMRYTVDVIAGLAFGTDINTIESEDDLIQEHLNVVFPMLYRRVIAPFPYWRYFRLPVDRRLARHLHEVHAAVDKLVRATTKRLAGDPSLRESPTNFLEAMLAARDADEATLSDADIASNVITMLLAGEDTTANTLAWLIHLVARQPDVARRLKDEAHAVLGVDRYPTSPEHVAALLFTEACAHETMRLKPVAPFLLLETNHATTIGDIAVPANTTILTLLRPGATDEQYFPRAADFVPERWMQAEGAGNVNTSAERISMPFGAGARICPGRNLALLEIKMVAAMLFRNFELDDLRPGGSEQVEEHVAFTMGPTQILATLALQDGDGEASPHSSRPG